MHVKKHKKIVFLTIIMLIFNMLTTLPLKAADANSKVSVNLPADIIRSDVALWKLPNSDIKFDEIKNADDNELKQKFGDYIQKQSILSKEKIIFDNLSKGTYYIKQLDSDEQGKRLSPILFEITSEGENLEVTGKPINPNPKETNFKFLKVDKETRVRLKDAVFEVLVKKDGNFVVVEKELTSNEKGEFELHDVPLGEYYLREIKAPSGYKKLDYNISFNIVEDSSKNYLEVENEKLPTKPNEPTPNTPDMPNTGDASLIYASFFGVSLFLLGFIIVRQEKN